MPPRPAPISLTTDFGQTDPYVGQMKGVILRIAPETPIVDITHAVPPQNVSAASFLLADLPDHFPSGTVHLAVVDPGVGSSRRILALRAGDQFFIAPDNGLLTLVMDRFPNAPVVALSPHVGDHLVSHTFHGRDLMAPAAGRLARGDDLFSLGNPLESVPIRLDDLLPRQILAQDGPTEITGRIVWIDHFGNLITNISEKLLGEADPSDWRLRLGPHGVSGVQSYYAETIPGEVLMLIGSTGRLEIAVRDGSAAQHWNAKIGDPVSLRVAAR